MESGRTGLCIICTCPVPHQRYRISNERIDQRHFTEFLHRSIMHEKVGPKTSTPRTHLLTLTNTLARFLSLIYWLGEMWRGIAKLKSGGRHDALHSQLQL